MNMLFRELSSPFSLPSAVSRTQKKVRETLVWRCDLGLGETLALQN